jgi:hypothetical protein
VCCEELSARVIVCSTFLAGVAHLPRTVVR